MAESHDSGSQESQPSLRTPPPEQAFIGFEDKPRGNLSKHDDLESRIASYWFLRIGIVAILIGFVIFAQRYAIQPWSKVAAGYVAAAMLAGVGLWKQRLYRGWAEPLISGGLAISYFTTYAMGFVSPMRLISSVPLMLLLLTINVIVVFAVAEYRKSEAIAGLALVLGYITTAISATPRYALYSLIVLSAAAVLFMWRNRFFYASTAGVLATYAAHLYAWKFLARVPALSPYGEFSENALFLTAYFLTFAAGGVVSARAMRERGAKRAALLSGFVQLNVILYAGAMVYLLRSTAVYWHLAWAFFLPLGLVLLATSLIYWQYPGLLFFLRLGAVASFTAAIISYFAAGWEPAVTALLSLAVLAYAARWHSNRWAAVSIALMLYAAIAASYTAMRVWLVRDESAGTMHWWNGAITCGLLLACAVVWNRGIRNFAHQAFAYVDWAIAGTTAIVFLLTVPQLTPFAGARYWLVTAVPALIVAAAAVSARSAALYGFSIIVLLFVIARAALAGMLAGPAAIICIGSVVAGVAAERIGSGSRRADYFGGGALYLAAHAAGLLWIDALFQGEYLAPAIAAQCVLAFAVSAAVGSPLLATITVMPAVFVAWFFLRSYGAMEQNAPARMAALVAAALLGLLGMAYGSNVRRVGEAKPLVEAFLLLCAAGIAVGVANVASPRIAFFTAAACGTSLIAASVLLVRPPLALVGIFFHGVMTVHFAYVYFAHTMQDSAPLAWYGAACAALLVASERLLAFQGRFANQSAPAGERVFFRAGMEHVQAILAVMAMLMLLASLRVHPAVQRVLFTALLAVAAALWILLGFVFVSKAYRRIGFGVVCAAIIKAFAYDVRNLPETYKYVSFFVLGLLLIGASFLYTRWRDNPFKRSRP